MAEQSIQSQDIKIADVFQAFYVVPNYQREYVWQTEQVEQLLGDINAERGDGDPAKAPEYFIGSIVVCPRDAVLELIDGQQRMTTLFLILCAVRDRLRALGAKVPNSLTQQIASTSVDAAGVECDRYRLALQYADSGDVLVRVAEGDPTPPPVKTTSIANILNAYEVASRFLQSAFQDELSLRAFYGYLTNKVKLIRIQTEDVAKALKIFETINDRGVGLNAMDLLKNLLFMRAEPAKFEQLKVIWKELVDTLFAMGEKPLRFLRYYIFSRYDVDVLREDEIYTWFSKNEAACGYARDPLGFARSLLEAAGHYRHFLEGRDRKGNANRYLENLRLLGGRAARQHLILLLAARHLPEDLFSRVAREVEDLFFVYVITREPTRDFERDFARWASDLRKVQDQAGLDAFVARRFTPAKLHLSTRFDDAFERLQADAVQRYRLVYILAKLTQRVELDAYGETEGTKWLSRYVSGGFDIEHIHPQGPSDAAKIEFGPAQPGVAQRLGNLTLVERSINASLKNQPYSAKRPIYLQSQLLLTRALAVKPKVGAATRIDSAVSKLTPFDAWNEAAIQTRQTMLTALARSTWNM